MKIKILIILVIVALASFFYFGSQSKTSDGNQVANTSTQQNTTSNNTGNTDSNEPENTNQNTESLDDDDDYDDYYEDIVPATELYSSADDAYEKILAGVEDYDDIVLEQFAELPDSCEWCPALYQKVKDQMLASTDENEKGYLAELLAITGKQDNLETLFTAYDSTDSEDDQELYLEALEFAAGDDNLVEYLSSKLDSSDELLNESVIAAISNHGSRLTVETLYKEAVKSGDPDGHYALGMGLGEVIPDDDSMPYLVELANQKDEYSHLAVKALLNYGDDGLREVVDLISNSDDSELNKKLLEDALDHVTYDSETEKYVREISETTTNADVKEFADAVLEDMDYEFDEDYDDEDYEDS